LICTSKSLWPSTTFSRRLSRTKQSSSPFGSFQLSSDSVPPRSSARPALPASKGFHACHFHYSRGFFHPSNRLIRRLLDPCFKTGDMLAVKPAPRPKGNEQQNGRPSRAVQELNGTSTKPPQIVSSSRISSVPRAHDIAGQKRPTSLKEERTGNQHRHHTNAKLALALHAAVRPRTKVYETILAVYRFQGLFTLSSKFFSPFLHSTCSLSV